MKKITDVWIKKWSPCSEAMEWWDKKEHDPLKLLNKMMAEKHYVWANWFIVRIMTYKHRVSYAVFAAEQVIDIFEKKYPNDKRPREAINAAKKCIKNGSSANKGAVDAAGDAAWAARAAGDAWAAGDAGDAWAARAARDAARAAWDAAWAAEAAEAAGVAGAAARAAWAAEAAARAAWAADAAEAAWAAAGAAEAAMRKKILEYGIKLLEEKEINE